jgi:hypothetical protein
MASMDVVYAREGSGSETFTSFVESFRGLTLTSEHWKWATCYA